MRYHRDWKPVVCMQGAGKARPFTYFIIFNTFYFASSSSSPLKYLISCISSYEDDSVITVTSVCLPWSRPHAPVHDAPVCFSPRRVLDGPSGPGGSETTFGKMSPLPLGPETRLTFPAFPILAQRPFISVACYLFQVFYPSGIRFNGIRRIYK